MSDQLARLIESVRQMLDRDTDVLDNEFQRMELKAAEQEHEKRVAEKGFTNPPSATEYDQCDSCGNIVLVEQIVHVGPFDYCKKCLAKVTP